MLHHIYKNHSQSSSFYLHIATISLPQITTAIYYIQYKLNYSQYFAYGQEISKCGNQIKGMLQIDDIIEIPLSYAKKAAISGHNKAKLELKLYLRRESVFHSGIEHLAGTQIQLQSLYKMIDQQPKEYPFRQQGIHQGAITLQCYSKLPIQTYQPIINLQNSFYHKQIEMMNIQKDEQYDKHNELRNDILNTNQLQYSSILPRESIASLFLNSRKNQWSQFSRNDGCDGQRMKWLIEQNDRLQKLVILYTHQHNLQKDRHQQQIKSLARQLSIKQAQLLTIRQIQHNSIIRTGQLLDEKQDLYQQTKKLQNLLQKQTKQIYFLKLQLQNQSIFYIQQKKQLQKQIQKLKQQNKSLFYNNINVIKNNQNYQQIEQIKNKLKNNQQQLQIKNNLIYILENTNKQLKNELDVKQQQLQYYRLEYQKRLTQVQNIISNIQIQEREPSHQNRTSYQGNYNNDNYDDKNTNKIINRDNNKNNNEIRGENHQNYTNKITIIKIQDHQYQNIIMNNINIIQQQQQQQSLTPSKNIINNPKQNNIIPQKYNHSINNLQNLYQKDYQPNIQLQFPTSQTITLHSQSQSLSKQSKFLQEQYELLKLLTKNLQKQYDYLKQLYRTKQNELQKAYQNNRYLQKQIQNMKFEMINEMGRVTVMVNEKLVYNQNLRLDNQELRRSSQKARMDKIGQIQWTTEITNQNNSNINNNGKKNNSYHNPNLQKKDITDKITNHNNNNNNNKVMRQNNYKIYLQKGQKNINFI